MQLLPKAANITDGEIIFRPKDREEINILKYSKTSRKIRELRGKDISMIFQDPMSSLNPVYRVGDQILKTSSSMSRISKKEAMDRAIKMLSMLSIPMADQRVKDYPHQFSGGMKQRVMIAMGLITNPELLIADAPTTALDVTIQAQILELMQHMQDQLGFTIIIITHNMGNRGRHGRRYRVMYMGRIVEFAPGGYFLRPSQSVHESAAEIGARPRQRGNDRLVPIRGNTPDPSRDARGLRLAPRCDFASAACEEDPPYTGHRRRA
jgi:peptide/nickel transport system ATP-binding protein